MTPAQSRLRKQLVAALQSRFGGQPARIPEAGRLAWGWFLDLHGTREQGMAGPKPINFLEIDAYERTMRLPLEPHHVELIRALDAEWMRLARQERSEGKSAPMSSGQAVTPTAFDAVFG